jgi:hypothetical protein
MTEPPSPSRVPAVLRAFGAVLLLVGALGYLLPPPPVHPTALIPAALGIVALLASFAGRWPMAAASGGALVAAVALMGGGSALAHLPALLSGEAGAAIASRAATAIAAILALGGLAWSLFGTRRAAA